MSKMRDRRRNELDRQALDDVTVVFAGRVPLPPLADSERLNAAVADLHTACFAVIEAAFLNETLSHREFLLLKDDLFAWSGRYLHWTDRLYCATHGKRWNGQIETPDVVLAAYDREVRLARIDTQRPPR